MDQPNLAPRALLPTPEGSSSSGTSSSFRRELRAWARDLLIAAALAIVIIVFLYQPVKVEGTSMAPLLDSGGRSFTTKFLYRLGPTERSDIVVFWYPLD